MAEQSIPPESRAGAPGQLARATVMATFALVVAGGLVTSRDAGLAVPDWPLSFGTLNPPRWFSIVNVRTEHGHRLAAACVALLTCAMAFAVIRQDARPLVRRSAVVATGLVLFQALLGGLRVLHLSVDLAMVHALTAQVFLAVVVVIATMTSPRWFRPTCYQPTSADRWRDGLLVGAILGQLVLGIFIRHLGASARPLLANGVFHAHIALGLIVAALAYRAWRITSVSADQPTRSRAFLLLGLVLAQIVLGLASFAVTEAMSYDRQATTAESWLPTLHLLVGAAILAACVRSMAYSLRSQGDDEVTTPRAATIAEPSR